MPTSDSNVGTATVPPSGYRLPPALTEVIRQQAAVAAVAATAHVPVVRPPVIDTRGFLSLFLDSQKAWRTAFDTRAMLGPAFDTTKLLGPTFDTRGFLAPFLDGQKAFRATFDTTKLLSPTFDSQKVWRAALDATKLLGPTFDSQRAWRAAFDTRAMLGPAFDVTKLLGPTFDTMRLFDASVAAIARGHSGTMEDWLAPVISEIVGTSAEQDVETGLSSVRSWSATERFVVQCYVSLLVAAALIYCGVAESAVLNLIGISAGAVGASAASPWELTGKLYDRLHGR